jgi:hypothetical protein
MAKYLLVAHQTAKSPQLLAAAQELIREDSSALFVLLVPATPIGDLVVSQGGEMAEVASRQAESARTWLQEAGVRLIDAKIGDPDPLQAIGNEQSGEGYEAIVLSTLPQGVSRWLRMDVVSRLRREFPSIRVEHVVSELPATAST